MTAKEINLACESADWDYVESVTVVTKGGREYVAYNKDLNNHIEDTLLMFWAGDKRAETWVCIPVENIESINIEEREEC